MPRKKKEYCVRHRTAQEMGRGGNGPWIDDGPFKTYELAKKHWDEILPNWQEGPGVVIKCSSCNQLVHVCK